MNLQPWKFDESAPSVHEAYSVTLLRRVSPIRRTVRYERYVVYYDDAGERHSHHEHGPAFDATLQEWEHAQP